MHKLYDYACEKLKELEKKADNGLSSAEIEYAAKLTELKKNILKIEMLEQDSEYSGEYSMRSYRGGSYGRSYDGGGMSGARGRGRGARRDSMGRYSSDGYSSAAEEITGQLEDMIEVAPDERTRNEIQKLISKMRNG
jgi:hypothetical protein